MFGDLAVDLLDVVGVVGDEHLLHDGQLAQAAAAHLHELHEAAAGDLALAQADGRQALAAFGDADQLFIQRLQPVGAHHQLHETRPVQPDAAQHVFTDGSAEVQVRDRRLLAEEGLELLLVEEEVHDDVDLGRVADEGVPAALLDGVELRLAWVLTHHVDVQVLQVDVFLRGERQQKLVTQQVVVQSQFTQAVTLISHT